MSNQTAGWILIGIGVVALLWRWWHNTGVIDAGDTDTRWTVYDQEAE